MSMYEYPKFDLNDPEFSFWLQKLINKVPKNETIEQFYMKKLVMPPVMNMGNNSRFNGTCMDIHPDIISHLHVIENQIYPKLGLTLKQSTKDKYLDMSDRITNILNKNDEYNIMVKKVHGVLTSMNIDLDEHIKHHGF
jgi:hypothetical protein